MSENLDENKCLKKVFNDFEKQHDSQIPEILKNILELMEYSKVTISKLKDKDILEIETSTLDLLEDLNIPKADYFKYVGRFAENPSKFRLLPGQKAILNELIVFCNKESFLKSSTVPKMQKARKRHASDMSSYDKGKPLKLSFYIL